MGPLLPFTSPAPRPLLLIAYKFYNSRSAPVISLSYLLDAGSLHLSDWGFFMLGYGIISKIFRLTHVSLESTIRPGLQQPTALTSSRATKTSMHLSVKIFVSSSRLDTKQYQTAMKLNILWRSSRIFVDNEEINIVVCETLSCVLTL